LNLFITSTILKTVSLIYFLYFSSSSEEKYFTTASLMSLISSCRKCRFCIRISLIFISLVKLLESVTWKKLILFHCKLINFYYLSNIISFFWCHFLKEIHNHLIYSFGSWDTNSNHSFNKFIHYLIISTVFVFSSNK